MTISGRDAALYSTGPDGERRRIGEVIEVTAWREGADGELHAPPGTCPICARQPLGDEPAVCPHGVATRS